MEWEEGDRREKKSIERKEGRRRKRRREEGGGEGQRRERVPEVLPLDLELGEEDQLTGAIAMRALDLTTTTARRALNSNIVRKDEGKWRGGRGERRREERKEKTTKRPPYLPSPPPPLPNSLSLSLLLLLLLPLFLLSPYHPFPLFLFIPDAIQCRRMSCSGHCESQGDGLLDRPRATRYVRPNRDHHR